MDEFDIGALDNVDFDKVAENVESKTKEADDAASKEAVKLRENANVCEGGACTI